MWPIDEGALEVRNWYTYMLSIVDFVRTFTWSAVPADVQHIARRCFLDLAGGAAHVTSIDSSGPAIERAKSNVALNGFEAARTTMMDADVNASLRQFYKDGQTFDAIVLDPPKFAPSAAHADRAARAYKDINRLAFKILEPGGVLFTYSCSGGIGAELFHKIVASAGTDAGVDGYISERMQGAPDHPMTLTFPEGEYLKGLVVMKSAALVDKAERATITG